MATLREQFEQSKKDLTMADEAVSQASTVVEANAEYRNKKALDRDWHRTVDQLKTLFAEAGSVLTTPCTDFEKFRQTWGSILPMSSPLWEKVNGLEADLCVIERQIKAVNSRKYKHLLEAVAKAKAAKAKCEADFKKLRDLFYREKQAREARHSQDSVGFHALTPAQQETVVDGTVRGTVHVMERSRRYGDSHTAKAPRRPNASDAPKPNKKKGKGSKKQQAREAIAAGAQG